jgi:hypothetical protein
MTAAPLAISLSRADALLGARHGTVAGLIRAGRLRAIPWGPRSRVLVADLERVAAEGFTAELARPRAPRARRPSGGDAAAIRAIDLDSLRRSTP